MRGSRDNKQIHIKKLKIWPLVLIFIVIFYTGYNACSIKKHGIRYAKNYQLGTLIELSIYEGGSKNILTEAFELISALENKLSRNIGASEVSKINRYAGISPVEVSDDTFFVINRTIYYSELSGGFFDITVGPLVSLWGIGTKEANVPSAGDISNVLALIDYKRMKLTPSNNLVFSENRGMEIDLGAIAKGFIADKVYELFKEDGVKSAIINLGGNVMLLGRKPDGNLFRVGIQNPLYERGVTVGIYEGENVSVVTSGIYERYYEEDGIKYHHIFDPKTGYPIDNDIAGISVITAISTDADALSTSLFALGAEDALGLVEKLENTEAIIITKDKKIILSSGVGNSFTVLDNDFVLEE